MKLAKSLAVAIVCTVALALAAPAFAQSPATSAYGGACGSAPTACEPNKTLPFTGIDAGTVALLGVVLLGAGFAVRRSRLSIR